MLPIISGTRRCVSSSCSLVFRCTACSTRLTVNPTGRSSCSTTSPSPSSTLCPPQPSSSHISSTPSSSLVRTSSSTSSTSSSTRFLSTASSSRSIEQTYQKKTALEHVLLRPGMYIGSDSVTTESGVWVYDAAAGQMKLEDSLTYALGLVKLFDEILVNAMDNGVRDPTQTRIGVAIDEGTPGPDGSPPVIAVINNGKGVPVRLHKEEGCYVPELVFGNLLTGSNFDDKQAAITGGRHGYGAKLTNIFSTEFTVETVDTDAGLHYTQTWRDNMHVREDPVIKPCGPDASDFTRITFKPDVERFGLPGLDSGTAAVMRRRVVDAAGTSAVSMSVELDGQAVPVAGFPEYMRLFTPDVATYHTKRWHVGVAVSPSDGFQAVSFVNGINTPRGGTHVTAVTDQLCRRLAALISKRISRSVSSALVRSHVKVFVNSQVPSPTFDSQAKERLMTPSSDLKANFAIPDRLLKEVAVDLGLAPLLADTLASRERLDLARSVRRSQKSSSLRTIPKLEDANDAGGRKSGSCTLVLTEGDSAKALAVAGLSVVGRDKYGVFPLRGKLLNVRDLKPKDALKNEEVSNLVSILGLDFGKRYETEEEVRRGLRYGRVMIMADQDHDGSHIKGLIVNLFHRFWPNLLKHDGFLEAFITPLVKARAGKAHTREFYSLKDYNAWLESEDHASRRWTVKYYKGLGTNTAAEGRAYFSDLPKHVLPFMWSGDNDGDDIDKAFANARVDDRKQWLLSHAAAATAAAQAQAQAQAQEPPVPTVAEPELEPEDPVTPALSYSDFINHELVEFSRADLVRSIPAAVDGLKPSQRKVLFAALRRGAGSEVKVSQLAGYCSEHTAYHHGEASLVSTIVKMAQDYVGSNNVPLLLPVGQFGTRLQGGKDAASARYIFTKVNPVTRLLFPAADDPLLEYVEDDGQVVEPVSYVPILPLVLLNGTEGIGTGWSTFVPSFNPLEVVDCLLGRLGVTQPFGQVPDTLKPWYRGFTGSIAKTATGFVSYGTAEQEGKDVRVTELPVGRWTDDFKSKVLVKMIDAGLVESFKEYHTVTDVEFLVRMTPTGVAALDTAAPETLFKLKKPLSTRNMHLFHTDGRIKRYGSALEVLDDHFPVREELYGRRKAREQVALEHRLTQLQQKARFVSAVIDGKVKLAEHSRPDLEEMLVEDGYVAWRRDGSAPAPYRSAAAAAAVGGNDDVDTDVGTAVGTFDYLLNLPLSQLTRDAVDKATAGLESTADDLDTVKSTSVEELWTRELVTFRDAYIGSGGSV